MHTLRKIDRRVWAMALCLALFVGGFSLASHSETAGGYVTVERVDFVTNDGCRMSAKLYLPQNAAAETPAPAILALPGGNASLENLSAVAIELSRRGYVVMAVDPYTIGRSDAVSRQDVGARAAMDYLAGLRFVDETRLGALGHSAGAGRARWAVTVDDERTVLREGVRAVFYLAAGSFDLEGVNMGVFIGSWDNTYGQGKLSARDLATAELFTAQLNTDTVALGHWYETADGHARVLYSGNSGHPTALLLPEPLLDVAAFFDRALAPAPHPQQGTAYAAKELGTALGLAAMLAFLFPMLSLLLETDLFSAVRRPMPAPVSGVNAPFVFYLVLPAVVNALLCKWAVYNGQVLLSRFQRVLRINNANGFVFWFGCSALLSVLILAIRFRWDGTVDKARLRAHARIDAHALWRVLLLALAAFAALYAMTYAAEVFWGLSPRLWKVQLNVLSAERWGLLAAYLPLYLLFFGVFGFSQTIGLRIRGQSQAGFTRLVWLTSFFPAGAFLLFTYGKLWLTGFTAITNMQMSRANATLLNCVLTYFFTAKCTTWCYRKTGGFHLGAAINAAVMAWTAVATDLVTVI